MTVGAKLRVYEIAREVGIPNKELIAKIRALGLEVNNHMTSAAVVARVKRALRVKRVGHTGTLDPMATGVLPLCLGEGTKLAGFLLADDKAYEATLELGVETDTLDADGQVTRERREAAAAVVEDALRECLTGFVGAIEQVPPMAGNAAEWASDGRVRGGSALDDYRGRCSKSDARDPEKAYDDVGYRCCADAD